MVKIIGVFAFLAPVDPHQNQFPATLRRGQLRIFMKGDHSITSIEIG
ncbi:replication protein RepA [Escherichia coli]|nr:MULTISPECIES: replication protein RepA [Enterobacteriaceae]MDR7977108.1 replication protein RepA [Escherichia coli]MDR7981510.1 replication protein RepA [Escherichia coli]MDS1197381.1 replication protein RepA [Escherichia coli]MDT1144487.1 replication protein RepA [Escherichia coli]MDT1537626.1 replication protein RepA [Escherichia coli]